MAIELVEITEDSETGMLCAAFMRIASFPNKEAFLASNFTTDVRGPYRATETDTFDIWADDPQLHDWLDDVPAGAATDPARKAYLMTERLQRLYRSLADQGQGSYDDCRMARELDDRIGTRRQLDNDMEKAEILLSRFGF